MNSYIAVIFVGATRRQNQYWWPSFNALDAGVDLDLIYVNREFDGFAPEICTSRINRIYNENKVFRKSDRVINKHTLHGAVFDHFNKKELPNKAFGAYAYYFNKYKSKYQYFAFVSDDVYLRRDFWLKDVVDMFEKYPKMGFLTPMLHNCPRHIRAPIWFGRTECLEKISWDFKTDHEGEMEIADLCTAAGYFGAQIGHKVDLAYDPEWSYRGEAERLCGTPMPMQFFETSQFGADHYNRFFTADEIKKLDRFEELLFDRDFSEELTDASLALSVQQQRWNITLEIQPYHGLLYNPGLHIARAEGHSIKTFEGPIASGPLEIDKGVYFGRSHKRYNCLGISKENPIAILND